VKPTRGGWTVECTGKKQNFNFNLKKMEVAGLISTITCAKPTRGGWAIGCIGKNK